MKKCTSKIKKKIVKSKKLNKEVNMIDIVKNKVMGIWNGLTVKKKITAGVIAVVIVKNCNRFINHNVVIPFTNSTKNWFGDIC